MAHQFTHKLTKTGKSRYSLYVTVDCHSDITNDHKIQFMMTIQKDGNRCWRVSSVHQISVKTLDIDPGSFFYTLKEAREFYLRRIDNLINFNLSPITDYTFAQNSGGFYTIVGRATIPGVGMNLDVYCAGNPYNPEKLWDGQIRVAGRVFTAKATRHNIMHELEKIASNFAKFGR